MDRQALDGSPQRSGSKCFNNNKSQENGSERHGARKELLNPTVYCIQRCPDPYGQLI
uniref:Uncharacterized protein n=1 Tax=Rhizophora mucronata TaxID=61149 RepID=A0A2P2MH79_RHIMU